MIVGCLHGGQHREHRARWRLLPSTRTGAPHTPNFNANRVGFMAGLASKVGRMAVLAVLPVMVGCAGLHHGGSRIDSLPQAIERAAEAESAFDASRLTDYSLLKRCTGRTSPRSAT